MGTSSSNAGAGSSSPLVPPWADVDGGGPGPQPEPQRFRQFRGELGKFVRSGEQARLKSALGHYGRSGLGGGGTAARRFGLVTQAGGALFGLLTDRSTPGTAPPLDLGKLVGKSVDEAITAIVDALAAGGAQDQQAIRQGMAQALSECLDSIETFDPTALSQDSLVDLFQRYITEEIVIRVQLDSGDAFAKADDPVRNVQAEKELKDFVKSVVDVIAGNRLRQDLSKLDARAFDGLLRTIVKEVVDEFSTYA